MESSDPVADIEVGGAGPREGSASPGSAVCRLGLCGVGRAPLRRPRGGSPCCAHAAGRPVCCCLHGPLLGVRGPKDCHNPTPTPGDHSLEWRPHPPRTRVTSANTPRVVISSMVEAGWTCGGLERLVQARRAATLVVVGALELGLSRCAGLL
ncbi:hypothetical protein NDU88_001190 [Pleurodeles waltl]|uniref:Uncharacterized protein n=1 Tax=Pleurodeles waltl TaxID=8319 RepID=A0AAV7RC43_PLEWA|nr:hypothetical protein NDU88_001190 [Pleurodeles waltl]